MDQDNFDRFIADFRAEQDGIRATKGREYVDRENDKAAGNLRRAGRRIGCSPKLVWAVYAGKHFDALLASASPEGSPEPAESLRGRFLDLSVYCMVGAALWQEEEKEATIGDIMRRGLQHLMTQTLADEEPGGLMAINPEWLPHAKPGKVPPSKVTLPAARGDGKYEANALKNTPGAVIPKVPSPEELREALWTNRVPPSKVTLPGEPETGVPRKHGCGEADPPMRVPLADEEACP